MTAAGSIMQAIKTIDPDANIELRDIFRPSKINSIIQEILAFIPGFAFPGLYTRIWLRGSWRWIYSLYAKISPLRNNIIKSVESFSPDLIICTHTFPCTVISQWKDIHPFPPLFAVATDQYLHPYWPLKNVDAFIAPNEKMKFELIRRGYEKKKIYPFGIPVNVSGKNNPNRKNGEKNLKIVVLAGSFRIAPYLVIRSRIIELMEFLENNQKDKFVWQFVFGKSLDLANKARKKFALRKDIEIFNLLDNLRTMLANADLIFAKPGGLIVAEAMALKKPIVLLTPGAGQERGNTNYVLETQTGILLDTKDVLLQFIKDLSMDPHLILRRFRFLGSSYKDSARKIAELAIKYVNKNQKSLK
jgi:processive 1,2-diacylglycerol beta-glucosyltransferase